MSLPKAFAPAGAGVQKLAVLPDRPVIRMMFIVVFKMLLV